MIAWLMNLMRILSVVGLFVLVLSCVAVAGECPSSRRPNVLFIAVDDLNDWISLLDDDAPIRTPHLERLAQRGVSFTRAYCASPMCNPSRVAVMTGLAPARTGVYGNQSDWRRALPDAVTIGRHFMAHGYRSEGAGKIFHHAANGAFHDKASFHEFFMLQPDRFPKKKLNGLTHWVGGRGGGPTSPAFDWGAWPPSEADTPDVKTVDRAIELLERPRSGPFLLAVGIFRPHSPWYAPPEYFEPYCLDRLVTPTLLENDLDDIPPGGERLLRLGKPFIYRTIMAGDEQCPGTFKRAVQAYQACASFADAQIGRLIDALDRSSYANSTIIVLWSDHGFHLGEKAHWEKFALWEKTTRVPFVIVAPGIGPSGIVCDCPVSLLDVYPTLNELCGLEPRAELDGTSLVPLLQDPHAAWERPAVMTCLRGNHAVRDRRWRYIHYADGSEELYDHRSDPNEWHNLADDEKYINVIAELKRWLPKVNASPVSNLE